jgi:hypothetical protein
MSATYDDLVDRLQALRAWLDAADRKLQASRPGDPEATKVAKVIPSVQREHDNVRRAIRNHPDAPPAG